MASVTRVHSIDDVTSEQVYISFMSPDCKFDFIVTDIKDAKDNVIPTLKDSNSVIAGIHEYRE